MQPQRAPPLSLPTPNHRLCHGEGQKLLLASSQPDWRNRFGTTKHLVMELGLTPCCDGASPGQGDMGRCPGYPNPTRVRAAGLS